MTPEEILLLGKLSGQIESVIQGQEDQDKKIGKLFDGLDDVRSLISKLPCKDEFKRLENVEKYIKNTQDSNNEVKVEQVKGWISLKNGVVIGLIAVAPQVIFYIIQWFKGG